MDERQHDELYHALVAMCQQYGTTTADTYKLLHEAIAAMRNDEEE
jgi:hypothetical protein